MRRKSGQPPLQVPEQRLAFTEPAIQAQEKGLVLKARLVDEPMLSPSFGAATGEI